MDGCGRRTMDGAIGAVARASIAIDRGRVMMMNDDDDDAWWWCLDLWVVVTHGAGFRRHTRARGCACACACACVR